MNNPILVTILITLKHFNNDIIAISNNGINGFGSIDKNSLAYKPMREKGLIEEDGRSVDDCLSEALTFEVKQ